MGACYIVPQIGKSRITRRNHEKLSIYPNRPSLCRVGVSGVCAVVNQPPIADPGPDRVVEVGSVVAVDGSGSKDDSTPPDLLKYNWIFSRVPSGSKAVFDFPTSVRAKFIADLVGFYTVELRVTDTEGLVGAAKAQIEAIGIVSVLVANAGPDQEVRVGDVANLDGSASTGGSKLNPLIFVWRFLKLPVGSKAQLYADSTPTPGFIVDVVGTYVVGLGLGLTDTTQADSDEVIVTGISANVAPRANAGRDQSVRAGDTAFLDGRNSSDDNTPTLELRFKWTFVSTPDGSRPPIQITDPWRLVFGANVEGTYVVSLVVIDEEGLASKADEVLVSTENLAPTAVATADNVLVVVGSTVKVNGEGSSDPEGDTLHYAWTLMIPTTSHAVLDTPTAPTATFVADVVGNYSATLTVSDHLGAGMPDAVAITAVSAEDLAQAVIVDACTILSALSDTAVTTGGNQNALLNSLTQAATALEAGDIEEAINKLTKAIIRTDGCILRGEPDGNGPGRDWVTNCGAQEELYDLLTAALDAITE